MLRFYYDNGNEYENEIFVCSFLLVFLPFGIVVVDDEMEAMSRSSLCVQKRNENDSDISLSFSFSLSSWSLYLPIKP